MADCIDIISQKDRAGTFLRIRNMKSNPDSYCLSMIDRYCFSVLKIDDDIQRLKRKARGYTNVKKIKWTHLYG